jgi:hypothetical protein
MPLPTPVAERIRYAHLWLPGLLLSRLRRAAEAPPRHVWLTLADHFEPLWQGVDAGTAEARVAMWRRGWPEIAERHRDSDGRRPSYTFFYPQEEYRPNLLEPLAEMSHGGIADVEVHIHHDGDGEAAFVDKVDRFISTLHSRHGLLRRHEGRIRFGFIHGNWALDNARPDGRWCGLNNEITLLRDLGCYADFTMPAPQSPCQAGPVDVVYRVTDDPLRPRSHARGVPVRRGLAEVGDLTLIPGPLGLAPGSGRTLPRVETGELAARIPVSRARARTWLRHAPRIDEHAFVKLFAHGAQERDSGPLLNGGLDLVFDELTAECARQDAMLHFVTAWEMWLAVEALRRGEPPHRGA